MAQNNLQIPVEINIQTNEQSVSNLQSRLNRVARTARNSLNTALNSEQAATNLRRVNNLLGRQAENLGRLKGKLGTVLSATKKVMSAFERLGSTAINTAISGIKRFTSTTQSAISAIKGMYNKVTGIFNVFNNALVKGLSLAALVKLSKEALEISSNLIEVQNVVDTTFEDASSKIDKFATSALSAFGLTELQAKKYASTIGAITKASGLSSDATLTMSKNLTKLSADVASFFNYDFDTAFGKIRSGLTGETEPLKDLGINMTVANLEAYRLAQGIDTSYNSMSAAEQMALRYNFILSSLKDTQGDFNKTQGTWANQLRILQGQLQSLGAILGNLLQKILYPVLIVLNQIVAKAVSMGNILAKAFGFDTASIEKQQSGTETVSTPDTTTATNKEAKAQDNLAKSTKKATAAKKKQNKENEKQLASIHKLNILNKKSTSKASTGTSKSKSKGKTGTSAGAGNLGTGAALSFQLEKYAKTNKKAEEETTSDFERFIKKIKQLAKEGQFEGIGAMIADAINTWVAKLNFDKMYEKFTQLVQHIGEVINGFVHNLKADKIGEAIGKFINVIVATINQFFNTIDWVALGQKLGDGLNGLIDSVDWIAVGEFLTNKVNAVFETLAGLFTEIDWVGLGEAFTTTLNSMFENMDWDSMATSIIAGINGLITAAGEFVYKFDWAGNGAKIGKLVGTVLQGIDWQGLGIDLSEGLTGALDFLVTAAENMDIDKTFDSIKVGIKAFFENLFTNLKDKDLPERLTTLINKAVKKLNELIETIPWDDVYKQIQDFIGGLDWGEILHLIANIWGMKKGVVMEAGKDIIKGLFQAMIKKAGEWVDKLKDKLLEPFKSLKDSITSFFGSITGTSEGAETSFSSSSDKAVVYSMPTGFSVESLPHLASGAVIPPNNQFLAVLGDQKQGTNIETPLNTMVQAFKSALSEGNYNGTGDIYIPVYVNNELTSEEVIRKQEIARYRSNGKH